MTYCLEFQNHKIKKIRLTFIHSDKQVGNQVEKLQNLEEGWEEAFRIEMLYCIEQFRLQYTISYA